MIDWIELTLTLPVPSETLLGVLAVVWNLGFICVVWLVFYIGLKYNQVLGVEAHIAVGWILLTWPYLLFVALRAMVRSKLAPT